MTNYYVQEIEKVDPLTSGSSRDRVSLNSYSGQYGIRSFKDMAEFDKFAIKLGIKYKEAVSTNTYRCGKVTHYDISHIISDPPNYFWSLEELPAGAKKITLTENGQDVTCYYITDSNIKHIFRPNPNSKEVYKLY